MMTMTTEPDARERLPQRLNRILDRAIDSRCRAKTTASTC